MSEETKKSGSFKWRHPAEVMKLQKLKMKKKALQARMNSTNATTPSEYKTANGSITSAKRKNPFIKAGDAKRGKPDSPEIDESGDNTLFKLLHMNNPSPSNEKENFTSFTNILSNPLIKPANAKHTKRDSPEIDESSDNTLFKLLHINDPSPSHASVTETVQVKSNGKSWIPIDWSLKRKIRFLSSKPFAWNQTLKISEEASGVTSFARCLDTSNTSTSLDISSNSKFHQCCLYWQQPSIPWLNLFPRSTTRASQSTIPLTAAIKTSMHNAWMGSLRSLFHLIRTRQCPYFYACANSFTVLFRAAGVGGFGEMHVMITPTTRGFRAALRQEEIEFTMPLKSNETDNREEHDEEHAIEQFMHSMGINKEDIKQINYTQEKITQKAESKVDNSEHSLVLIQGVEVQAFYSYLVHCKSAVSPTGLFAGIPPTLLAPVAFHGATLMPLQVRESRVHVDNEVFYSLDLGGPILPHAIHNLCALHPHDNSLTATFSTLDDTAPFSKINLVNASAGGAEQSKSIGSSVFNQENLKDCGLMPKILKHFCSDDPKITSNVECLKYTAESTSYAWT